MGNKTYRKTFTRRRLTLILILIDLCTMNVLGTAVAQWLRCCTTNRKVAGSIPAGVIGIFHWHKIHPIALWPWGRLSLKQKWVPGTFPGGKDGRCVRLTTLPPSCAVVMKSGNLNFLEPSGPLQACNGTALSLQWMYCFWSICDSMYLSVASNGFLLQNIRKEHEGRRDCLYV